MDESKKKKAANPASRKRVRDVSHDKREWWSLFGRFARGFSSPTYDVNSCWMGVATSAGANSECFHHEDVKKCHETS
jgi:hypothetical protein